MNIYLFYKKVINKKSLNEKKSEDNDEIITVKPIKKTKKEKNDNKIIIVRPLKKKKMCVNLEDF
jgi:hypothetical protein